MTAAPIARRAARAPGIVPRLRRSAALLSRGPSSLRVELIYSLALLAAAAILLAVFLVFIFDDSLSRAHAAPILAALVLGDAVVFVLFAAHKVDALVLRPLDDAVAATTAIAAGDLSRKVPPGSSAEFARLASSVNRMTTRLLEEQALLARLEKIASIGRLATGVAHEIGNPLGSINGYVHLLRRNGAAAAGGSDALAGIEREAERIDRILRGMLDYARPRRRSPALVDVGQGATSAVSLLRDQGALKSVEVTVALDHRSAPVHGDAHQIEQLFVNLILNAVDAMEGRGTLSIVSQLVPFTDLEQAPPRRAADAASVAVVRERNPRLRAWLNSAGQPESVLRVVVADSGSGVPLSESERIFDPFYTTKEPGKGTGLGLAIVSRIVESMGGAVWVRASREGGAAFVLVFPVDATRSAAPSAGG